MSESESMESECKGKVVGPGEWVRRLGYLEGLMAAGGQFGTLNTVQGVWLASPTPIPAEAVRRALTVVAHQMQVLQLCVVWRGLRPWFRRLKHLIVPFKVELDDVMSVFYKTQHAPYDMSRGPLWRARLVPLPPRSPSLHEAVLIINAHHCITDGLTNMVICRNTVEVLNAIMSGRNHQVPSRPVIPAITDELVTRADWYYIFMYFCSKFYATIIKSYNNKLYFNGALPQPETKLAFTRVMHEEFTVEMTQQLLQRCKEAEVTVHSCILAAANLAILNVVQQRSEVTVEAVKINGINCVNMRRYYPLAYKEFPGCHISMEEREILIHSSDANSKENFWALAKRMHNDLRKSLNVDKNPIRNSPLFQASILPLLINKELTRRGRKHCTDSHFVTTNMGDLRDLLPSKYGDGPVEITNLLRSVSSEFTGSPYTLGFHTFRNRFMVSLDYYSTKVTEDVATLFFSTLTTYISNIASHGTVKVNISLKK